MTRLRQKYKNLKRRVEEWNTVIKKQKLTIYDCGYPETICMKIKMNPYIPRDEQLEYYDRKASSELGQCAMKNNLVEREIIQEPDDVDIVIYRMKIIRPEGRV